MSATFTGEELCMDMGVATTDCVPRRVDEDLWTQCARHGPGGRKGPVSVTNRSIIYRLHPPQGVSFLVVLNGLWVDEAARQPFAGLRALEHETGATVRAILSPGASHHLSLAAYARAFPEARVCVAEGRIPRQNPALVALDNVDVYAIDAPPPELEAAGLRVRVMGGLMEGRGAARVQLLTARRWGYVCDSTEPLMVLQIPTGTVTSGGHQWWFLPEGHDDVFSMPGAMRVVLRLLGLATDYMRPGAVACETNHGFAVRDHAALQVACRDVLDWDFEALLDLHAPPNTSPRSGAKAMFEAVLEPIAAGDWSRVPWEVAQIPAP